MPNGDSSNGVVTNHRDHNSKWYLIYKVFQEPMFYGPIVIMYLMEHAHVPQSYVYYQEIAAMLLLAFMEVATGSLADHIGRRKTVLLGRAMMVVNVCLLATIRTPWQAFFVNLFWAIGFSLASGADTALVYDSETGASDETHEAKSKWFLALSGKSQSFSFLTRAIGSVGAGFLYAMHPSYPFIATLPGLVLAGIAVWMMRESEPKARKPYSVAEHKRIALEGIRTVMESKQLRWIVLLPSLVGVTHKLWFFSFNPYFQAVGVPTWAYGVIFGGINLVSAYVSYNAERIQARFGEKTTAAMFVMSIALPMTIMGLWVSPFAASLIFIANFSRGIGDPFVDTLRNKHIRVNEIRATVISVSSMIRCLVEVVLDAAFGWYVGATSTTDSLILFGVFIGLVGGALLLKYDSIFGKEAR